MSPLPPPPRLLLPLLGLLWVAGEVWMVAFRRAGAQATRKDRGSLRRLNAVIYSAAAVGMTLGGFGLGRLPHAPLLQWMGFALMVLGLGLRLWAIRVLAAFFTVDVAIHRDHALVASGPYRWVRHPSYTGLVFAFTGLALSAASWVSLLLVVLPIVAALLHRIRIEERALREAFPDAYPSYSARTHRLFPGLY